MFLGDSIKNIHASMVSTNTGVDGMDSVMIEYENGKMATMFTTMYSHTDRRGLITGEKGYIIVENINNPERILLFNTESGEARLQKEITVPEQITGYEYELLACKKALDSGKTECAEMPHSETIEIMRQMDEIRKQWGLVYPCE